MLKLIYIYIYIYNDVQELSFFGTFCSDQRLFAAVRKFAPMVGDTLKKELQLLLPRSQLLIELLNEGKISLSSVIDDCKHIDDAQGLLQCFLLIPFRRVHGQESRDLRKAKCGKESFCIFRTELLQAQCAQKCSRIHFWSLWWMIRRRVFHDR